jgi:hypothetical protein
MIKIVKETNEETKIRVFEWYQIVLVGMINGWQPSDLERGAFDRDSSRELCETLKNSLHAIGKDVEPLTYPKEPFCPYTYLAGVIKGNQMEVIG